LAAPAILAALCASLLASSGARADGPRAPGADAATPPARSGAAASRAYRFSIVDVREGAPSPAGTLDVWIEREEGRVTVDELRRDGDGRVVERVIEVHDASGALLSLDEIAHGDVFVRRIERRDGTLETVARRTGHGPRGAGGVLWFAAPPADAPLVGGIGGLLWLGSEAGPKAGARPVHRLRDGNPAGLSRDAAEIQAPPAAEPRFGALPTPTAWAIVAPARSRFDSCKLLRLDFAADDGRPVAGLIVQNDPPVECVSRLVLSASAPGPRPPVPPLPPAAGKAEAAAVDAALVADRPALEWIRQEWHSPPSHDGERPLPATLDAERRLAVSGGVASRLALLEPLFASKDAADRYVGMKRLEAIGGGGPGPEQAKRVALLARALADGNSCVRRAAEIHLMWTRAEGELHALARDLWTKSASSAGHSAGSALVLAEDAETIAELVAIARARAADQTYGFAIQLLCHAPIDAPGVKESLLAAAADTGSAWPSGTARRALQDAGVAVPEPPKTPERR